MTEPPGAELGDTNGEPDLDTIDRAIIAELQIDGRLSYAQLAPRVGLSQAATRHRVQRLLERGLMQVVAVTDPVQLGYGVQAMVAIGANGDITACADRLARLDQVDYVVIVAGRYDILAEVVCRSTADLLTLVNEQIRTVEGVASTEILAYLKLVKQTYSWGVG